MTEVTRYPRQGHHPLDPTILPDHRPLRLAVVYEVCFRFRMPVFRRLAAEPTLMARFFVGSGIPGTKVVNAPDLDDLDVRILSTLRRKVVSTGRNVTASFNPTLLYHLFRFRPDVILVQGGMFFNNLTTLAYSKLTGTPIAWWTLGQVVGRDFKGLSLIYRKAVQWVERQSTVFVGYSSMSIDYFLKAGYPADRCFNLVNVIDTDLLEKDIIRVRYQVPELRKKLLLDGTRVVLFVGSLTETKGVELLVEAYARLVPLHPDLRLLIVGDGPRRRYAMDLASRLGVESKVIFTGAVYDDVAAYFQLGDLLVIPGTGGLAISEGMAHGLPVICSIGDGVEVDLIDEGMNGYRIPPNDVERLVEAMAIVLQSADRPHEMGLHSLRIIREYANIGRYMCELLSAVYSANLFRPGASDK